MKAPLTEPSGPAGAWTQCKTCFEYFRPNSTDVCSCAKRGAKLSVVGQQDEQQWETSREDQAAKQAEKEAAEWARIEAGQNPNSTKSKQAADPWAVVAGQHVKRKPADPWVAQAKTAPTYNQWEFYKAKQQKNLEETQKLLPDSSTRRSHSILVSLAFLFAAIAVAVAIAFGVNWLVEYFQERQKCYDAHGSGGLDRCFDEVCQQVVVWATSGVCAVLVPALVVAGGGLSLLVLLNLALWHRCEQKVLVLGEALTLLGAATVVCCVLGPIILVEQSQVESDCGSASPCTTANCSSVLLDHWACSNSQVGTILTAVGYSAFALLLCGCALWIRTKCTKH